MKGTSRKPDLKEVLGKVPSPPDPGPFPLSLCPVSDQGSALSL